MENQDFQNANPFPKTNDFYDIKVKFVELWHISRVRF